MNVYKGGLTGGDIAVGYHIEYIDSLRTVRFRADVVYNGVAGFSQTEFSYELLEDVDEADEGFKKLVAEQVELALMDAIVSSVLDKVDAEGLADKVIQCTKPQFHPGGVIHSVITDDEVFVSFPPDAPSPIEDLKAACAGLNEVVEYPRHLDPDADWPPQADDYLHFVIVGLNDRMGWSFERIADWLETLDVDINIDLSQAEGGES